MTQFTVVRVGAEGSEFTRDKFYVVRKGTGDTHANGKNEYLTVNGQWEPTCLDGWFNSLSEIAVALIRSGH